MIDWLGQRRRWLKLLLGLLGVIAVLLILRSGLRLGRDLADERSEDFTAWFAGSEADRARLITERAETCPGAPFLLPTRGFIGLVYADPRGPYSTADRHQGIDIFSPGAPGQTPVYAAYDGYITRLPEWRSSVIQRIPDDPLNPGRQIWVYYTHMAPASGEGDYVAEQFPPGAREVFVQQGELIGYTGNYSGTARPVGTHLHFSIVLDDGGGNFRNELDFDNTVDPSRYLGMPVNYACYQSVPECTPDPLCAGAILSAAGS